MLDSPKKLWHAGACLGLPRPAPRGRRLAALHRERQQTVTPSGVAPGRGRVCRLPGLAWPCLALPGLQAEAPTPDPPRPTPHAVPGTPVPLSRPPLDSICMVNKRVHKREELFAQGRRATGRWHRGGASLKALRLFAQFSHDNHG